MEEQNSEKRYYGNINEGMRRRMEATIKVDSMSDEEKHNIYKKAQTMKYDDISNLPTDEWFIMNIISDRAAELYVKASGNIIEQLKRDLVKKYKDRTITVFEMSVFTYIQREFGPIHLHYDDEEKTLT